MPPRYGVTVESPTLWTKLHVLIQLLPCRNSFHVPPRLPTQHTKPSGILLTDLHILSTSPQPPSFLQFYGTSRNFWNHHIVSHLWVFPCVVFMSDGALCRHPLFLPTCPPPISLRYLFATYLYDYRKTSPSSGIFRIRKETSTRTSKTQNVSFSS